MPVISDKDLLTQMQTVDPMRCTPWKYHNRDVAWLTRDRCLDLIVSIQKNGQIEPAIVRRINDDPRYDFEIICGVRRWFACSEVPHQKFLVCVTNADDKTCMILMHAENADSKDISEFERAFSFAQQMNSGVFKNQTEMADAMGVSQGTISKMIKAAEIFEHDWIRGLFHNKLDISVKHAYMLSVLLKKPEIFHRVHAEALTMKADIEKTKQFPPASKVLKILINEAKPSVDLTFESTLLAVENKAVMSCRRDKFNRFYIIFDSQAKELNHHDVEAACLNALREYVFENQVKELKHHDAEAVFLSAHRERV